MTGGLLLSLFDPHGKAPRRSFEDPSSRSEPTYQYLNRTTRPELVRVRCLLEDWFSHYGQTDERRAHLVGRFRSADCSQHDGAFFELYLNELLLRSGFDVCVEPDPSNGSDSRPDFLATDAYGNSIYVEAHVIEPAEELTAARNRQSGFLDSLDRLGHPRFCLAVETVAGRPTSSPAVRGVRKELWGKLEQLDPVLIQKLWATEPSKVPCWSYELEGWVVKIRPIPVAGHKRSVGLEEGEIAWHDSAVALREAIQEKATRYGKLLYPLVIALNDRREIHYDETDLLDAILGDQTYQVILGDNPSVRPVRKPNGALKGPEGARNPQVAGLILSYTTILPWSVARSEPFLLDIPWATGQVAIGSWPLARRSLHIRQHTIVPTTARIVFNLPEGWPSAECDGDSPSE